MSKNTTQPEGLAYPLRRPILLAILLGAALIILMFGCSDDKVSDNDDDDTSVPISGTLVVPPGWNGDWQLELSFGDCESDKIYAVNEYTYSMGVGDTMKINICPILEACAGVATGDSIIFSCYDTIVDGACSVLAIAELQIALQNDTLVGEGEWTLTLQGDCSEGYYTEGCEDIIVGGTITQ